MERRAVSKSSVGIGALLVALIPWMSGGREPLALLISVFSLCIAWYLLLYRSSSSDKDRAPDKALGIIGVAWLGWGSASLLWTVNRYETQQWINYALLAIAVFCIVVRLTTAHKRALVNGYLWVATGTALYGLGLYFTGDYGRLTSSFYWANPCAAFILPAFIIGTQRYYAARTKAVTAQVLLIGVAFWLTDSRGAVVAALAAAIVAVITVSWRQRGIMALVILLTFGVSVGVAEVRSHVSSSSAVTPGSRFSEAARGESTSISDRVNYLKSALAIWREQPTGGSGAGTYPTVHPAHQLRVVSASNDAHNYPVQTLAEQGLVGLIILGLLAAALALGVLRGIRANPAWSSVGAAIIALSVHFGLDIDARYPALIVLLAVLAGVAYKAQFHQQTSKRAYAMPLVLLFMVLLTASFYRSVNSISDGQIYDDSHDYVSASKSYAAARRELVYDPDAWTAEGIDYYTVARITGSSDRYVAMARERAKAAIARDPEDSQHYFLLGRVERLSGKSPAAERAYRDALDRDPWNHPDYYADLAELLMSTDQLDKARVVISRGTALYPAKVVENRSADPEVKQGVRRLHQLASTLKTRPK